MKGLIVLLAALLLVGCDRSPDATPTTNVVFPGSTCSPIGAQGFAADRTAMRCSGSGVWRMEVKSS